MNPGTEIVVVGEGMLELSRSGDDWRLGYGGDTLNTAIHLARMGFATAYMTALGSDPFSNDLRGAWQSEGVDSSLVMTSRDRGPGLYSIRTDERGERSFHYWRDSSAARQMFELQESRAAMDSAAAAGLLVYSLISLAILPPSGRERLLALARNVRSAGGRVAFDGNYRPVLWASAVEARDWRDQAIAACDFGLPTLDDEQALTGRKGDALAVAGEWRDRGASEVIVKLGEAGCLVDHQIVSPPARIEAVDTSGAGDAFNAAYLAARLSGQDRRDAALAGHRLAGWVVGRAGAIPPRDAQAPYPRDGTCE